MATPSQLAYDAGLAQLSEQGATLDGLRARAATVLTANSIVAAFLGAAAIKKPHPLAGWGLVGCASFVVAGVLVSVVLLRIFDWDFTLSPKAVLEKSADGPDAEASPATYRALATVLDDYCVKNEPTLHRLMWVLIFASLLVPLQSVAWLVRIA